MSYPVFSQQFTEVECRQGYALRDDTTVFIYDDALYQQKPSRVVVTGSFRAWDANMNVVEWMLKRSTDTIWLLSVVNPNWQRIVPGTEFKFRIDNGIWLDLPVEAPNEKGTNYVFQKGLQPAGLLTEIRNEQTIWAKVQGNQVVRPSDKRAYRLTDAWENEIPIATIFPFNTAEVLVTPASVLDKRRVYFLEIIPVEIPLGKQSIKLKSPCSFDGWFRELYSDKELGANLSNDRLATTFRVFAPRAEKLRLYLYAQANDKAAYYTVEMEPDAQGVWETTIHENLLGCWYDFTVHGSVDPGNYFYESHPVHISDPYARVSDDSFGKCRVWAKTQPATPLKNGIPLLEDVIAYEVHIQDFTDQLPLADHLKGTIPAMVIPGLRNTKGEEIGFDYLVTLGINVVHLMPMQEFMHYPDEAWQAAFARDTFMKEQGIDRENYDWGYRTTHAFAIESRYRQKDTDSGLDNSGAQREQFRDLVQAFHDHGIAVIVDMVFNHTAENMDGRDSIFHFKALDAQYYYRTCNLKMVGEYGNEIRSEDRPMVQRWVIDQCLHFINEFGVDGFRIDLAGLTDADTLLALKKAINKGREERPTILYGEPWIAGGGNSYWSRSDLRWTKENAPITYFQDDSRHAFKGPISNPHSKATDRGYAGGNYSLRTQVKKALSATFPEDKTPLSRINYLDIHDNWALADQLAAKDWDGRFGVDEEPFKMAAVLLYTSLGPIVTHGGTEMMRSKGLAPLQEMVKIIGKPRSNGRAASYAKLYFHGKRDTYNLRKANQFVWENVGKTKNDKGSFCNYAAMQAYWRGLNRFRLSPYGQVFRQAQAVSEGYFKWIEPANEHQLGYLVNNEVLVLLNTEAKANTFEGIELPQGSWRLVGNIWEINLEGVNDLDSTLTAGQTYALDLPATSVKIWVKVLS